MPKPLIILLKTLGFFILGIGVFALVVIWRVTQGPLELSMITPLVERALNDTGRSVRFTLGDITLARQGDLGIGLLARDMRLFIPADAAAPAAVLPEISVRLALPDLLRGDFTPKALEVVGPHVVVNRDAQRNIAVFLDAGDGAGGFAAGQTGLLPVFSGWLAADSGDEGDGKTPPRDGGVLRVGVRDARISYRDEASGAVYYAENADLALQRFPDGAVGLSANGVLPTDGGNIAVSLTVDKPAGDGPLRFTLDNFRGTGAALAALAPPLAPALDGLGPTALTGTATVGATGAPLGWDLRFVSGGGGVVFTGAAAVDEGPDRYRAVLDVSRLELSRLAALMPEVALQGWASGRIRLSGVANFAAAAFSLAHADMELTASGGRVVIPAMEPRGWRYTEGTLLASLTRDGDAELLNLSRLSLKLPEAALELSGRLARNGTETNGVLQVTARDLEMQNLAALWPEAVAPQTRQWMLSGIPAGRVTKATLSLNLDGDSAGGISPSAPQGEILFTDAEVYYYPTLPPLTETHGKAVFDADGFDIAVEGGHIGRIYADNGRVRITGMRGDPAIDITTGFKSPLRDVLTLLNRPPLSFIDKMDLRAADLQADVGGALRFAFPLYPGLQGTEIRVDVDAELQNLRFSNMLDDGNTRITAQRMRLLVDNSRLELTGDAYLNDLFARLSWRRFFEPAADEPNQLMEMTARLSEGDIENRLGFPTRPWVSGPVDVQLKDYTFAGDVRRTELVAGLRDAALAISPLDWGKDPGAPAQLSAVILRTPGAPLRLSGVVFKGGGLEFELDATLAEDMRDVRLVELDRLVAPMHDFSARMQRTADGLYDIAVSGRRFDISGIVTIFENPGKDGAAAGGAPPSLPPVRLLAGVDEITHGQETYALHRPTLRLEYDGARLTRLALDSTVGNGAPLRVEYGLGDGVNGYELGVRADDAGAALRAFGLSKRIFGGKLSVVAKKSFGKELSGAVAIDDFELVEDPALNEMQTLMTQQGLSDAPSPGSAAAFARFRSLFTLDQGVMTLIDARAISPSIGFLFNGRYNLANKAVAIDGVVVPAYSFNRTVNEVVGVVPLFGWLLSGGQDKGLISASYRVSGTLDNPSVQLNPFSVVAPGLLKRLADTLSGPAGVGDVPPPAALPSPDQR